eukprot:SAG11_NODE_29345_length_311_cov_33.693396_1_plen_63_part_01
MSTYETENHSLKIPTEIVSGPDFVFIEDKEISAEIYRKSVQYNQRNHKLMVSRMEFTDSSIIK